MSQRGPIYVMLHMNVVKESNYSTFRTHLHTRVNPNLMLKQTNSIGFKNWAQPSLHEG